MISSLTHKLQHSNVSLHEPGLDGILDRKCGDIAYIISH